MPPSIPLAKSIAQDWRLRPRQLRRSVATRSSKAFPICSLAAVRAKARKLDTKRGILQNSRSIGDRHWLLKNIGGRDSTGLAPHRQFRLNIVAENANLLCAI